MCLASGDALSLLSMDFTGAQGWMVWVPLVSSLCSLPALTGSLPVPPLAGPSPPPPPGPGGRGVVPSLCWRCDTSPGAKQPRHKPEPCPCQGGAARACLGGGPPGPGSACPPGLFVTASGLAQISRDPVSADLGASQAPPGSVCILGQDPKPSTPM